MNKEQIAQWVIDNRYSKSENNKVSDSEMYYTLIDKLEEAINYTQCCETLPSKEAMNLEFKTLSDIADESGLDLSKKSMKIGFDYCYKIIEKIQAKKNR